MATVVPVVELIAQHIADFMARHDGYVLTFTEHHDPATRWDGGYRTLTVSVRCPTGEPRLTEDQS